MSNVTNVILIAMVLDEDVVRPFTRYDHDGPREWHGALGCITEPDDVWVHDGKGAECSVWVGAFNHFNRLAFLRDLSSAPWEFPESVQVLIEGQDDECFGRTPRRIEVGMLVRNDPE